MLSSAAHWWVELVRKHTTHNDWTLVVCEIPSWVWPEALLGWKQEGERDGSNLRVGGCLAPARMSRRVLSDASQAEYGGAQIPQISFSVRQEPEAVR